MIWDETDDAIRRRTELLIERLREHHPEQEYEPEGLRLPDDPAPVEAPQPKKRTKLPATVSLPSGWRKIIEQVAKDHDIDPADVIGRRRHVYLIPPRREVYRRLHEAGHGVTAIGRRLGRDHTTVRHHLLMAQRPT